MPANEYDVLGAKLHSHRVEMFRLDISGQRIRLNSNQQNASASLVRSNIAARLVSP